MSEKLYVLKRMRTCTNCPREKLCALQRAIDQGPYQSEDGIYRTDEYRTDLIRPRNMGIMCFGMAERKLSDRQGFAIVVPMNRY